MEAGASENDESEAIVRAGWPRTPRLADRVDGTRAWGLNMSTGLVWRTLLFLGLTAGYVIVAALPYLA